MTGKQWLLFVLALVGAGIAWCVCFVIVQFGVCDPGAPWFCRDVTTADRLLVLVPAAAAGIVLAAPVLLILWFPWRARIVLYVMLAVVVFLGTLFLAGVSVSGCPLSPVGRVEGCTQG